MNTQSGTILCVQSADAEQVNQCELLTRAGYSAVASSPQFAFALLSHRKFDIIVTAGLTDDELDRLIHLAGGADILSLGAQTMGTVVLFLVDEHLGQLRQRDIERRSSDASC